ncbi:MAG: 4'-phosphopantetheinyl transferase superfamily protein [Gemmatimonadetes bacterium]|nr:4'-phosphopantetheinyl transferase superfamily protein [Gemmatimonadota bacterium]
MRMVVPRHMPDSIAECWWRPFRKVGCATVLHVDLTAHADREAEAWAWLDEEEQARWQRYQHDGTRRRFALCRAALRAVLCGQLGCRNEQLAFGASDHGKPYAVMQGVAAPVSFNVSHSGAHGLIAVAEAGRLGGDVEERSTPRDLDGLISSVLGPDEQAELALARGGRKLHLFFNFWTIKEALIKALGLGLALDMSRFEIPLAMRHGETTSVFQFPQMPTVRWHIEDLGNEHFAAAIACELDPDPN